MNRAGSNDILSVRRTQSFAPGTQSFSIGNPINGGETTRALTMPSFNTNYSSLSQSHLETIYQMEQSQRRIHGSSGFQGGSRHYPPGN